MERLVYLDSSAIMRLVEGELHVARAVREAADGGLHVTSVIAITECLVHPIKHNDVLAIASYRSILASPQFRLISADRAISEQAATLRAHYRLKTPDAIHFATAMAEGCQSLITSDADFKQLDNLGGVKVVMITLR